MKKGALSSTFKRDVCPIRQITPWEASKSHLRAAPKRMSILMRTKFGSHLEKSLSARFPLVVDNNRRYASRPTTRKKATRQAVCCELGFLIRADWEKLAGSHLDSHIAIFCPRRRVLYVKPPLTWVSHRRPSRKAGSPYHGIGRGAVRRRSRERHRIAVRHAADPCGEEGARRRAQGGHRRGARLPSLRPGRPVALPEVRQPLLRAQGPGPRRRAAVAVPRPRQDVLRAHARPARIVEAARVGVDVLRRVHGRRAPPAGDGRPRRGPPSTRRGPCACGSARSWRCAPRTAGRGPSTSTAPWSWAA